jgi:hypothetical protein
MGLVRLVLGCAQMAGATAALLLLIQVGVTPLSLGVVVVTGLCTTVSVLLFESNRPRWDRTTRKESKR